MNLSPALYIIGNGFERLAEARIEPSVGSKGDNVLAETINGLPVAAGMRLDTGQCRHSLIAQCRSAVLQ